MIDFWIKAYKSLKTPLALFQTGFSQMALPHLYGIQAALMLYLSHVRHVPGRRAHLAPTNIPPQDRDIHLVEFQFCSDTNPASTLERAQTQHSHIINRLETCSLRNPNRNNKVTLHIILIGVGGTIYNKYTITPLINLGLTKQKAESLASQLRDHAIQRLSTIINTRHALCFQGASGRGGFAGRAATAEDGRRRVRALRGMAANPPDPH